MSCLRNLANFYEQRRKSWLFALSALSFFGTGVYLFCCLCLLSDYDLRLPEYLIGTIVVVMFICIVFSVLYGIFLSHKAINAWKKAINILRGD